MAPKKVSSVSAGGGGKKETIKAVVADTETSADLLRKEGIVCTFAQNSKSLHRNVRDVSVSNMTITFHGVPLVEEAELTLNYGNRYGFIGRNGSGKSTFMRVIGARSFPIADGIDLFHLKEEIEPSEMTAKEAVMSVDVERAALEKEADDLNDMLTDDSIEDAAECMERLTQVYERLEELDASTAEKRASTILAGLGFTPEKQNKKTKEFSGGWRMRISLARALFIQPTLLLLDEPTNHLDMEAVVWLEDYLSKWDKILLLVSHSQDFLNNVCTHIMHLHKKRLVYYTGNYDMFIQTRSELEEEQMKKFQWEQDQIKHMKDYVARFGQGNAKMARQAQSKEKVLEKMTRSGLTEKVEAEKALDFKFPDPGKLAPPVLQCNDLAFGYPGCEILYEGVDFGVDLDSRVALVGPNGAGKSTLLKIMTGELLPLVGSVRPHAHLRFSKFSQHFIDVLDLEMTPLDYFMKLWGDLTREDARKFLGRFGVSGSVQTTVMGHLSDGQKSRVVLAKMAKETPHLLLLDEPTNHLDMESIDSLAKAINNFAGGMVLVSHDMRLISQVAKEIWICDNKTVSRYLGEISDFKMHLRRQIQSDGKDIAALPIAPLAAKALGPAVKAPSIAPPIPKPTVISPPSLKDKDESSVVQARLELAEIAIAKQRARQAEEAKVSSHNESVGEKEGESTDVNKYDEKALLKAKKKAEKEAQAALEIREEEERRLRREQKMKDIEDAKLFREEQTRLRESAITEKAEKEFQKKLKEEEAAFIVSEAVRKKKEEKEARKRAKAEARLKAEMSAKAAMDAAVLADFWTQDQQLAFEKALLQYPGGGNADKFDRWKAIALSSEGKSVNQCISRYRYLKDYIATKKAITDGSS